MGIKHNILRVSRSRSGKSLSVYDKDGFAFGSVSIKSVNKWLRGDIVGAPIRRRDSVGRWRTVGWFNRTMKKDVYKLNEVNDNKNDVKDSYLGGFSSESIFSVLRNGMSFLIYPKKSKKSKKSGFKPNFK